MGARRDLAPTGSRYDVIDVTALTTRLASEMLGRGPLRSSGQQTSWTPPELTKVAAQSRLSV